MAQFQGSARGVSADPRKASVEASEFPMLCETCLGPNPYVRMMKESYGRECKICTRPFTVFRWKPGGSGTRYKKTEICQTCARVKNVCQTCLLDLQYGLPVQVRDQTLAEGDRQATIIPKSDVNREYTASMQERAIESGDVDKIYESEAGNKALAERLARRGPFYERNRTHVCSFFVRGECNRGAYCPYRHEMVEETELSQQNLKDRYYGVNDPVAEKILRGTTGELGKKFAPPDPPADLTVTTLFVGGITSLITEKELRDQFEASGEISSVRLLSEKGIAFVEMASRPAAEAAVQALHGRLNISGVRLSLRWARPRKGHGDDGPGDGHLIPDQGGRISDASSMVPDQGMRRADPPPSRPGPLPPPVMAVAYDARGNPVGGPIPTMGPYPMHPLPPGFGVHYAQAAPPGKAPRGKMPKSVAPSLPPVFYPSQDPNQLGSSTGRTPKTSGYERR